MKALPKAPAAVAAAAWDWPVSAAGKQGGYS
jgi:hypothetical protein